MVLGKWILWHSIFLEVSSWLLLLENSYTLRISREGPLDHFQTSKSNLFLLSLEFLSWQTSVLAVREVSESRPGKKVCAPPCLLWTSRQREFFTHSSLPHLACGTNSLR